MVNFENLLARLIEHRVEFVLVGGFAATTYGSTLLTQDVDVCLRFSPDNLMRLQEAIGDLHPVHRMTPRRLPLRLTPETCRGLKNLCLDTDLGQLDCLGAIQGVGDFEHVKEHSVEIHLAAGVCRILSLDALIQSKEAMRRPPGPGVDPTVESDPRSPPTTGTTLRRGQVDAAAVSRTAPALKFVLPIGPPLVINSGPGRCV